MVITVTCPSCSSSFPVDPAKIPEGGVNARCTQCADIFRIDKPVEAEPEALLDLPEAVPAPPPPAAAPPPPADPFEQPAPFESSAPQPASPPEPTPSPEAAPPPEPAPSLEPAPPPEPPPLPEPAPAPVPEPTATEEPAAGTPADTGIQGFTFGKRDPADKAKRLARVLVSDMIMYNAERHQNALAEGTLVQDFEEEIEKSWKEFVEQVGEDMANGDGKRFWTEALNDILAKGQHVF
jgi:predicted Zn finger-like uncharacterized protein